MHRVSMLDETGEITRTGTHIALGLIHLGYTGIQFRTGNKVA